MSNYQYVLFDLDGTVVDSGLGITNAVSFALEKFGIHTESRQSLYRFIGPPLTDSFQQYYGFSQEQALRGVDFFQEYYRQKGIYENTLYEGIEPLLHSLNRSGKTVILATSKPEEFARLILKDLHLSDCFAFVAGAEMDGSAQAGAKIRSKKEDVIAYALEQCRIKCPAEAVMVGDRKHDIHGAAVNGLDSIGVLFGYGSRSELLDAGATYIAQTPEEIGEIILG